jgi:hypothetical protein
MTTRTQVITTNPHGDFEIVGHIDQFGGVAPLLGRDCPQCGEPTVAVIDRTGDEARFRVACDHCEWGE